MSEFDVSQAAPKWLLRSQPLAAVVIVSGTRSLCETLTFSKEKTSRHGCLLATTGILNTLLELPHI
jgi:hypothetical protein